MDDLISRRAAIDAVRQYCIDVHIEDGDYHANGMEYELNILPSAKPERKKGNWLVLSGKCTKNIDKRIVECSVCFNTLSLSGVNAGRGDANFCPNCGADMRGKEE